MRLFEEYQQDDRDVIRQCFFGSEAGKRTLGMLLFELGFFSPAETEGTQANRNFAVNLVKSLADGDENQAMSTLITGLEKQWWLEPKKSKEDIQ